MGWDLYTLIGLVGLGGDIAISVLAFLWIKHRRNGRKAMIRYTMTDKALLHVDSLNIQDNLNVPKIADMSSGNVGGSWILVTFKKPVRKAEYRFDCSSPDVRCNMVAMTIHSALIYTIGNSPGALLTLTFGKDAHRGPGKAA